MIKNMISGVSQALVLHTYSRVSPLLWQTTLLPNLDNTDQPNSTAPLTASQGLSTYKVRDAAEAGVPRLEHVDQPPGSGDHDLNAPPKVGHLGGGGDGHRVSCTSKRQ